jgi:hypothetical protein
MYLQLCCDCRDRSAKRATEGGFKIWRIWTATRGDRSWGSYRWKWCIAGWFRLGYCSINNANTRNTVNKSVSFAYESSINTFTSIITQSSSTNNAINKSISIACESSNHSISTANESSRTSNAVKKSISIANKASNDSHTVQKSISVTNESSSISNADKKSISASVEASIAGAFSRGSSYRCSVDIVKPIPVSFAKAMANQFSNFSPSYFASINLAVTIPDQGTVTISFRVSLLGPHPSSDD